MRTLSGSMVITGATAGVGRDPRRTGRRRTGLIARDPLPLEALRQEVEALGAKCQVASADVADAGQVMAAADVISKALGSINVWVNDAMVAVFGSVDEITPEEFRRVTEVTYRGFVHGTMAALRLMRPANAGKIVQLGSALAYCGAKHAIRGFTDALRSELIHQRSGIELMMIQLPAVNTPQCDWARTHRAKEPRLVAPVTQPEAVADAIHRATAGHAREVWIGVSTVKAILGQMILPGWLDRYLARTTVTGQDRASFVALNRRDDLFEPVPALHRMHGAFDREVTGRVHAFSSEQVRLTVLLVGLGFLFACVAAAVLI